MQARLQALRFSIIEKANNPTFIHHQWFVKWHLEIVQKLALELCDLYSDADRDIVEALVWIHDYARILAANLKNPDQEDALYVSEAEKELIELGFESSFIEKVISYFYLMNKKPTEGLSKAPIEVQIISSADAASHFVGPFMSLYWHENSDKPFTELMADNVKKAQNDWNYKITLPEVKERFKDRYAHIMEFTHGLKKKYL